jgi:cell division protein FtsZ
MGIGEFQQVGETVREFASDDATVVVGTVIDPDLKDRIRVTVVATGLGQIATAAAPMRVVQRTNAQSSQTEPNYTSLDKPTVQRQRAVGDGLEESGFQEDLLDVPAFLRRQAD